MIFGVYFTAVQVSHWATDRQTNFFFPMSFPGAQNFQMGQKGCSDKGTMLSGTQRVAHGTCCVQLQIWAMFHYASSFSSAVFDRYSEKESVLDCGIFHFWTVNFTADPP